MAKRLPDVPEGYNYDFINADALIRLLSVKDGKIITPSGMSYPVLVLDSNARKMSLPVLRKIRDLVKAGATITGIKPESTPSLADDQKEFQRIVNEVWNSGNSKVFANKPINEVLQALNIAPDFTYSKPKQSTKLLYVHRKLSNGDLYWVNNRNHNVENLEATFRITGKVPEIWHPETGKTELASYDIANGVTKVNLHLQPDDAVFVVFKSPATKTSFTLPATTEKELITVDGSWNVAFQSNRGAPANTPFDQLNSWTESTDPGIKYFSGAAMYTKTINADASLFNNKKSEICMDLGDVKNIAEVMVNGKSSGIVWKQPFRLNVTNALKPGTNKLEIKVTNLWVNRLIGDQQPGVINKITYTTMPFYKADSPLLPSGLLGPVKIVLVTKK